MTAAQQKNARITSLRWGTIPYTPGSGLHVGCGAQRTWPNALGLDTGKLGPAVDLMMQLDELPIFNSNVCDFVGVGDALARVKQPRKLLAECWRVLAPGGNLIITRPTAVAYEWLLQDADDYCVMANLQMGAYRVDVVQKLDPGAGVHPAAAVGDKTCAIVRTGGFGDAIWASSLLPTLKEEGYHVTMYLEPQGEEVLRHDPNVDRIIVTDDLRVNGESLGPFWAHEMERYDRFINLVECVEKNMLAVPNDLRFYWPADERRRVFGGNYLEAVHRLAGVPRKWAQRFFPTADETREALGRVTAHRKTAVFAISGSTLPKFWPYADELLQGLVQRGYDVWVMGDLRGCALTPRKGVHVVGLGWSIRQSLAFSLIADVVVGQETGILNAVAFEPMRKVVLLSHSTAKNLTAHWKNTIALHGTPACWPCHQIHYLQNGWVHCNQDETTKVAKCQSTISVDQVLAAVDQRHVVRVAA